MIASFPAYTDDQRLADRDAAVREVLTTTAGLVGLSARHEQDIRTAVMRHVEPILHLADDAVAALQELEAIDRRLDNHVQMCGCWQTDRPCLQRRVLQIRRRKLQGRSDAAYRALLRGRA